MSDPIPNGFVELAPGLGFTDVLRPLYRSEQGGGGCPIIGLLVREHHTNLMNICHGGVLMTLADVGAAWSINHARGEILPAPTLNLSFDFINAAKLGDWLQANVEHIDIKRRVGFASGVIQAGSSMICRFSGTFYLPAPGRFDVNASRMAALHGEVPTAKQSPD